eukprot:gnl/TRDRNA2_/TRDRNA2_177841_c7_seq2.p1 gnl/TRDRNA2_/TRDRNA2_177841_c7~~gnl/TRDRNA2_/TRDRNA2_177841_c7_seq2.p1  ORF type:complete len:647 (+),score=258.12 gnl/TRDRNA2_/TRDRNA2_177841_c7_seq2:252-1943(+)
MAEAGSVREKEAAAFAAASADLKTNLGAMDKAIPAIEQGSAGSFLQTESAAALKNYVMVKGDLADVDRQDVLAFLSNSADYAPQSGQIVGILKTLKDEMTKELADTTAAEDDAIKTYEELLAAKKKETEALTAQIEEKSVRFGDVSVEISTMKNDLEDTTEAVAEDTKFAADLEKQCATKEAEWDERCKLRSEEILAIADTIKILNNDDALELFKKTSGMGSASFLQMQVTSKEMAREARKAIQSMVKARKDPRLDLIALVLRGKKVNFDKVLGMVENMITLLKKEQVTDDEKKAYCEGEFDKAEDEAKVLARALGKLTKAIGDCKEGIATAAQEIKALAAGIEDLDKEVASATEQRQEENSDFKTSLAANTAAKELIKMARERMAKFYHGAAFIQVSEEKAQILEKYTKQGDMASGVLAMMDGLIKDIELEITEMETEENNAQEDYETFMADSKEKRATDTKALEDKEAAKADLEVQIQKLTEEKTAKNEEKLANDMYTMKLHKECDFIMAEYDARKQARTGEIDALTKAKGVLSGADFALVQTGTRHRLLRTARKHRMHKA